MKPRPAPVHGRGATVNVANRFHRQRVEAFDPSDDVEVGPAEDRRPTEILPRQARSIVTRNDSPDVPFDRSINPYQGCEHGCIYCFARPTHAYWDLSPGLDFETKILTKPNAAELLHAELRRTGYRCEPIALGTNTDPYQPIERDVRATREILEVLCSYRHPFSIVTKSAGVLRDLDLIGPAAAAGRAAVFLSITTLDGELASRMEPRASAPGRRLDTIRRLRQAGVPVGVMASPMIPALNDHELEAILQQAVDAGAQWAAYIVVRLPREVRPLFEAWLRHHQPTRADRVLERLRDMRGGRLNDPRFGHRMRGAGPYADLLRQRFQVACRRLGLDPRERIRLDTTRFQPPLRTGDQRRLF